jgi:hypothetical protein
METTPPDHTLKLKPLKLLEPGKGFEPILTLLNECFNANYNTLIDRIFIFIPLQQIPA